MFIGHTLVIQGSDLSPNFAASVRIGIGHGPVLGPCKWLSMSRGRRYRTDIINERTSRTFNTYLGEKLKIAWDGAPIHSPRSRALARETPQATTRVCSVWAATYRILEMTTLYLGPTSPPTSWTSSAIRRPMFCMFFHWCHLRDITPYCYRSAISTTSKDLT